MRTVVSEKWAATGALSAPARPSAASADRRPIANIKPRLRMTALYFLANSLNCLVAGSSTRAAIAAGHFTKYGDGAVDIQPLGRLLKRQVRSMARDLGVPAPIIARVPNEGLWTDQTDEHELGFSDDELDR